MLCGLHTPRAPESCIDCSTHGMTMTYNALAQVPGHQCLGEGGEGSYKCAEVCRAAAFTVFCVEMIRISSD